MARNSSGKGAASEEEFVEFAAARSGPLFRSAYFLTGGDKHLAEDLVQETLGRMFAQWHRVDRLGRRIADPAAYAQTVLVRQFLSHQRRRSTGERPSALLPDRVAPEADPSLRIALTEALAQLAPKDRAVLVLRYWEDRSVEETAAMMRANVGAVRARSSRALVKLRALLGDSLAELAIR
ncbi:SigE family RNA polymerase sigma factor [Kitasatospora sp. NPDC006697]|uniref:SigE family RNA polymerase sigma factor n=1 Tax=Kitasatospora sp. NPDC006697 TaxID=3364020 RepID=UPI0036820FB0